jgi:hypothetical protein
LPDNLVETAKIIARSARLIRAVERLAKDKVDKEALAPACRKLEQLLKMLAMNDVASAQDLLKRLERL